MDKACIDKRTKELLKEDLKFFAKAGAFGLLCAALVMAGFVLIGDWMFLLIYACIPLALLGFGIWAWIGMTRSVATLECRRKEIEQEMELKIKELYQKR